MFVSSLKESFVTCSVSDTCFRGSQETCQTLHWSSGFTLMQHIFVSFGTTGTVRSHSASCCSECRFFSRNTVHSEPTFSKVTLVCSPLSCSETLNSKRIRWSCLKTLNVTHLRRKCHGIEFVLLFLFASYFSLYCTEPVSSKRFSPLISFIIIIIPEKSQFPPLCMGTSQYTEQCRNNRVADCKLYKTESDL